MFFNYYYNSPLEQFQIIPILKLQIGDFDFSITNAVGIYFIGLTFFFLIVYKLFFKGNSLTIIPNYKQLILENIYIVTYSLIEDNVGKSARAFYPYIFMIFIFVLISNVIGLVPYSFTITSHLIVTLSLALMTFLGINIVCIRKHGVNMLSLFLPPGASLFLALLLIPIEIVSYIFRPISLAVRLFANMMAGHTLLKVIVSFSWKMMLSGGGLLIAHIAPLFILVLLMGLEFGVAMIQAYVFSILTCIYLNDALYLH